MQVLRLCRTSFCTYLNYTIMVLYVNGALYFLQISILKFSFEGFVIYMESFRLHDISSNLNEKWNFLVFNREVTQFILQYYYAIFI